MKNKAYGKQTGKKGITFRVDQKVSSLINDVIKSCKRGLRLRPKVPEDKNKQHTGYSKSPKQIKILDAPMRLYWSRRHGN